MPIPLNKPTVQLDDEAKLAELILYISQKSANDANFGQVKLNKVLFFSDFTAYGKWGETITGAEYQRLEKGPTVRRMLPVQRAMQERGDLAIQPVNYWGFRQDRTVNLREPNLDLFGGKEIAVVDLWIERLWPMTAKDVSNFSHQTAAWRLNDDRDTIHEGSALIYWGEPSEYEVKRGQELAARFGLMA